MRTFFVCILACVALSACSKPAAKPVELKRYPINNLEGVITRSSVELDSGVSSDGKGSLKITAAGPTDVPLFETGGVDAEDGVLTYKARVRAEGVVGKVYLEMWCSFGAKGEFFSRGLNTALTGSTGWTTQQTQFFLKAGENPDNVKLNIVIDGRGTVWVDDVELLKERRPGG
ncbi:MAG: hypothetical protein HY894_09385 [Deltaproteobacteria bacterium]|nr:hypothetical protein [Deltaproteobacteria bacterium]